MPNRLSPVLIPVALISTQERCSPMNIVRNSHEQLDEMPSYEYGNDFYIDMCDSDDVTNDVMKKKLPPNNRLRTKGRPN